ncbi:hypothetical protein H6P81_017865 [Aristolochia fimbriata]|uniref:Armadillo-like repeats domain-containing protein n=1 Tax=Aristolochia fimbriata TaxID=158543 RepID=A0AAV7E0T8_ARIFI|nr:hypothetical protein H6P81_017865 [Aristolochia fimbriata]
MATQSQQLLLVPGAGPAGAKLRPCAQQLGSNSPSPLSPFLSVVPSLPRIRTRGRRTPILVKAKAKTDEPVKTSSQSPKTKEAPKVAAEEQAEEEEVEEDLPWIQEKALDVVEFTGTVTQAIPGPRVGQSSLPWILALPLAYVGLSFVIAVVKTIRKYSSPKFKRKRLRNKNSMLVKSLDDLFQAGRDEVHQTALKELMQKTGFSMEEVLRKYIRYALNEKPFNPDLVLDFIHLRRTTMLEDAKVAEILNETSRRIVKELGPVVMDTSGFTEKGLKRKIAVQALFGKIFYLAELPEFCSRDSSLIIKDIFGVTDEDADKLRIHTLSEAGDVDSLEKMIDGSDSEEETYQEKQNDG